MSWLNKIFGEISDDRIIDSKIKATIKCGDAVVTGQCTRNPRNIKKDGGEKTIHKSTNRNIHPYLADPDSYR